MRESPRNAHRAAVAVISTLALGATGALIAVPAFGAGRPAGQQHPDPHVVVSFRPNVQFAESLARRPGGALFASVTTFGKKVNHGQIYRITAAGTKTKYGPTLRAAAGVLTGVAFDRGDHLYVADATFGKAPAPGVFRVSASGATRVLTLPANTFPNGVVFYRGALFISDSDHGAVYRWDPRTDPAPASLSVPWLRDKRLAAGGAVSGIGPNGLAVRHGRLVIAVSDAGKNAAGKAVGRLAAVKLGTGASHGPLRIVRTSPRLATVDGITFGRAGALWLVTNGQFPENGGAPGGEQLLRLSPHGQLHVVTRDTSWLNYPTAVALVRRRAEHGLFLENGAFRGGTANILRLR